MSINSSPHQASTDEAATLPPAPPELLEVGHPPGNPPEGATLPLAPPGDPDGATLPPAATQSFHAGPPATEPLLDERSSALPPPLPGYEVLGELGRGGMGVVYKARQSSFSAWSRSR